MTGLTPTTKKFRRRLAAIKLLRGGASRAEVAALLGVTREAVRRWWEAYEAGDRKPAALRPRPGKRGPKAALTEDELRAVVAEAVADGVPRTLDNLLAIARRRHPTVSISWSALRRRLVEFDLYP